MVSIPARTGFIQIVGGIVMIGTIIMTVVVLILSAISNNKIKYIESSIESLRTRFDEFIDRYNRTFKP